MNFRWYPGHELATVRTSGHWLGNRLLVLLQIRNRFPDYLADSSQRLLMRFFKPAQARKLGTQADVLLIVLGPGYAVGEVINVSSHLNSQVA